MKMKTIMSIIAKAGLPALVILSFTACSWDCPGLPENMPWFIAEDYMYQTVSFTNGRDTVSIEYEGVVFENRSDKDVRSDNYGICELSVHQSGVGLSSSYPIHRLGYGLNSFLNHKHDPTGYIFYFDLEDGSGAPSIFPAVSVHPDLIAGGKIDTCMAGNCRVQYLVEWQSLGGMVCNRVLKVSMDRTSFAFVADTMYFADRKGLVQVDFVSEGETWYLIPPEDEAGADVTLQVMEK